MQKLPREPTMVTTERPTPSADGAPPPTMAWAGAAGSSASDRHHGDQNLHCSTDSPPLADRQGRIALVQPIRASRSANWHSQGAGLMVEAVIWDFGGVLTSSPFEAFARFESERGLPADIIRRTNASNHSENAWAKFERAEVDLDTFDRTVRSRIAGARRGGSRQGRAAAPVGRPAARNGRGAQARRRRRSKTGCITNNLPANAIGSASGRSLYVAEVMALFDHVIESAKIGLRKPDPRIYRMMVEALGVDPRACVYLDDLGVNLKPAREMGMTTIKVVNAPQAIAELEAATGLSLR